MKIKLTITKEYEAKYLKVSAKVRHWEDANLGGVPYDRAEFPGRAGDMWNVYIELETGKVLDWPEGMESNIYFKVCDEGQYWITDKNFERIAKWNGEYVPDTFLCFGDNGYGDYIIMNIDKTGHIVNYNEPEVDPEEWEALV